MKTLFALLLCFTYSSVFANPEILRTPKATKATIIRGTKKIPIDLSQPSARSQIKDYDVIMLEDGVYSSLGDFTAKYVRVRGKGLKKTTISSYDTYTKPILVNSTEFWDVSISDAHFKLVDQSGLWAVNVEFLNSILITPAALDKTPAFAIRTIFSDVSALEALGNENEQYAHFMTKQEAKEYPTAKILLEQEDKLDRNEKLLLKTRSAYKGLIARGMNYLYQKDVLKPQFDVKKYNLLTKNARDAKKKGHLYVSMLTWAEADRLSGHARFDEVLKEITPLNQNVSQECGCTVEGTGLASTIKTKIEDNLYAQFPVTGLPGRCKIQALHVAVPPGGNKDALIAAARSQNQMERVASFKAREHNFQQSITKPGGSWSAATEDDFAVGAEAQAEAKEFAAVADVELPGKKKSFSTDVVSSKASAAKPVDEGIITPITKMFTDMFTDKIKKAKAKIASADLVAKVDGFITSALYGDDPARQSEYEDLHEQQFGRKVSPRSAASSVFAY